MYGFCRSYLGLLGCYSLVDIADVTKSEAIILRKQAGQGNTHSISLKGIGGEAEISLMLNGNSYRKEKLLGQVDFTSSCDWYSE